jgi:peptide/nickel transport system substrate-binding protein
MSPTRKILLGLSLLASAIGVFWMVSQPPLRVEPGSVLRARLNSDIVSSDPGMKRDAATDAVILHVVEGLVAVGDDGAIRPMLAKRWTISPDGKTYRFQLRSGIHFHNGAAMTSADVKWSLERYLAPENNWRCKTDLSAKGIAQVLAIRTPSPDTVEVMLDRAAPLFLMTLARPDCGGAGIMHRNSVGPDGAWRYPIGTGPFSWGEWRRGEYIELVRFPGYQSLLGAPDGTGGGKHALVDRVRFMIIPDGSAASAALLRNSLDVLDALAPNELANIQGDAAIKVDSVPSSDFYSILLQSHDPALRDVRLRRALSLSLDVGALARVATRGTAIADSSVITTVNPFYGPVQQPLVRRNISRARALVKASGYKGQPIQLLTSRNPPDMYDVAILAQAMARDAGINLEIVSLDWATQLARYSSGNYQATVFGFSARLDPSLLFGLLIGDPKADPRKVWNSPRAIALLHQSVVTGDRRARQAIFDRLEAQFRDEVPAIILYNTRRITGMRSTVSGYRSWPGQTQRFWNVSIARHP